MLLYFHINVRITLIPAAFTIGEKLVSVKEFSKIEMKTCATDLWTLGQHLHMQYIDLRPGQTCHSKVMHRKEVTHSDGSYEKKSRRRALLTIWDKVKPHGTLIDWCTGREWPVNCMTVISAWWRSNMPSQRLSGRFNNYITWWRQKVS